MAQTPVRQIEGTPEELVAWLRSQPRIKRYRLTEAQEPATLSADEIRAADDRLLSHSVRLDRAYGLDNEAIDADLARAYDVDSSGAEQPA